MLNSEKFFWWFMEIDGWIVRVDEDGNMLRQSRERPDCYMITLLNRYAIDIQLPKNEVDAIPKNELQSALIEVIKRSIREQPILPWG